MIAQQAKRAEREETESPKLLVKNVPFEASKVGCFVDNTLFSAHILTDKIIDKSTERVTNAVRVTCSAQVVAAAPQV